MGNRESSGKQSKLGHQPQEMPTEISLSQITNSIDNNNNDNKIINDSSFKNEVLDKDLEILQDNNNGYMAMLSNDTNLIDQGVAFYNNGEFDKAETCFKKCIELNKVNGTSESIEYILACRHLAGTYRANHRIDEAIEQYVDIIPIQKLVLGPQHNDVLVTMTDLGILYRYKYDFDKAAPLYAHCYASSIHVHGEEHPTTAIFRNNLANLLTDQKKYDEAEDMYKQCIEASIAKHGDNKNATTLQYMNNLALLYMDQERYKEARKLFKKCIEVGSQVHGRHHPIVKQWRVYYDKLDECSIS